MATYTAPTGAEIRAYTRLQGQAFGLADGELETALETLVAQGEDRVFSRVGDSYETDDSLSARQVRLLQAAVSHRTGAFYLWELLTDVTGGTHEALLVAEPEQVQALHDLNEERAAEYEGLLQGAGQAVDTKPFALPAVSASTFTVSDSDRLPSERNSLLDISDDVDANDTENG